MHRIRSLVLAVAVLGTFAVPPGAQAVTISISGSTSIFPLASALAKEYKRQTHGRVNFTYTQGGSNIGVNDVARGRVTLGAASRDPLPSDPGGLTFTRIAYDAVCVITHPSNGVTNLSQAQIQSIFSGQTSTWDGSGIPGAGVSGPIQLEVRTAASGTQDAFQNIFLGPNIQTAGSADQQNSNGLVQQAVATNPQAIGYVSLAFTRGVHTVPYNGVSCTLRNAKSHQYGGVRNLWLVSRGRPSGPAAAWIRWIRTSSTALRIAARDWVPVK